MKPKANTFYEKVYDLVRRIPFGRVTTYGALAEFLGRKGSARMVGYAMNKAHVYEDVPAHRVVNRNGLLTGKLHFSPPELMEQLLENEGIEVNNDKIVNFKKKFWKPN